MINTKFFLKPAEQKMFMVMMGIGLLCGLVIVSVFLYTEPYIAQNKLAALENAISNIMPEAHHRVDFQLTDSGHFVAATNSSQSGQIVYATYNQQQQLLAIVIKAQGKGYQDVIELLYAYIPNSQRVSGLVVLNNRETPGLGAKISHDADFLSNFKQLDVQLNKNKQTLQHRLQVVKAGVIKKAWQIDSITGATISSKAIADIIQHSAALMLPLIQHNIQDFNYDPQDH